MPADGEPNPTPTETPSFNGTFLAFLIVCGALAVFFLLYFNRAFGSLLSWGIRTYTWHRYRVYIDIQALQVSLLGGRIFFTGLRYHGNNETFLVQHGYVTWRYWLRRVREVDIKASAQQQAEQASAATNGRHSNLPCRVTMSLVGLEWFIYNRSPAYDSVLAGLKEPTATAENVTTGFESKDDSASLRNRGQRVSEKSDPSQDSSAHEKESSGAALLSRLGNTLGRRGSSASQSSTPSDAPEESDDAVQPDSDLPFLLQLFPIFVTCQKAAVVMGNDNTKAILIVKADGLSGEIDASKTSTPDPYKQIFKIKFQHPIVEMRENEDFKEDQATRASREKMVAQEPSPTYKTSFFRRHRRRALGTLRNLVPYWRKSVESFSLGSRSPLTTTVSQIPGSNHWQGLARYLDEDEQDSRLRWAGVEYAAESTIMDSPEATLTIYWDVVGKVTAQAASRRSKENAATYINGDEAPAWGMILAIKGGAVNYGPWADRQRADLQRVFVPSLCKDAVPATPLAEGEYRVPTQFKLYVELDDEVKLRIPVREDSKNWKWKGKEPPIKSPPPPQKRKQRNRAKKNSKTDAAPIRPGGWLDLIVPGNATISFTMDMLASTTGYQMKLDVDLPSTELATSVNHELLWRSGPQRISCDLSSPLKWNSLRSWYFNVVSEDMELFILRDHVFLLTDLVDDWASGPPAEYLVFTPFRYYLNLDLRNVTLYLNVNDGNIINNPTDLEDNAYIVAKSPSLVANVCIPIDKYRPSVNAVSFALGAETFSLWLHVPPWNTQGTFITSKEIAHGENFEADGKYHYNATTAPSNIDTLELNLGLQSPTATLYGFIIRYVMKLKDNYLGDDIHFKTLEEYQDLLRLKEHNPDAELANRPPPKKTNDLDVILGIKIDDLRVLLPANLYSSQRHVQIETAGLSLDLRFTNYYMDLQVNLNPLNLSLGNAELGMETPISAVSSTQLFIDGLSIFGHRLFGLPPAEPTYLCNWDISVGTISGECSTDFLAALMSAGKAFAFEFDDDENALIPLSSIVVYDVTFLRVAVESVRVWCHVDEAAFLFTTGTLDVKFNDWARTHYSRRADIKLPGLQISCVNSESAMRHKWKSQQGVETDAFFQASIRVAVIGRKFHFSEERKLQQELIRREDQRTGRTEFLLLPGILEETLLDQLDPPAQGFPPVPHPTVFEGTERGQRSSDNGSTFSRFQRLRHKSSFLSTTTTSSSSSVIRPRSSVRSRAKSRQSDMLYPDSPEAMKRGSQHQRDVSTSTGRHSAFYSAIGDFRDASHHSSVAFSSQFHTPPFPLESIRPDTSEAVMLSIEEEDADSAFGLPEFSLDNVDPESLAEDRAQNSIIVEIPTGVTAFLNPSAVKNVSLLLAALQPSEPDNILDSLQISSMTDIFDHQKKKTVAGQITDVLLRIPKTNIRFLNASAVDRLNPGGQEQDQYDVTVSKLSLCLRSTDAWENPAEPVKSNTRTSVLLKLGSVDVSASERLSGAEENQAAFMAQIERVMVSMGSKDLTYIDADIGSIKSSTASEKIEYLASLIHRTGVVASELGETLEQTISRHEDRVKHFVFKLMTEGHAVGDPSFLTRPSAVLRSATEHLRTFDSWKMAARLRQIWTHMPVNLKNDLQLSCLSGSATPPPDASHRVIEAFQRWRSWDLYNVADSSLIKNVFGPIKVGGELESPGLPILAALRLKKVQLLLDPGPKENRIVFADLTTRLEKKTASQPSDIETRPKSITVLNVYCGEAAVMLNWELCELAEDILRLYNKSSLGTKHHAEPKQEKAAVNESKPQDAFHVVLAVGRGSVEVDTINLSATSLGHNLKASCLLDGHQKTGSSINFIISCDAVTSRLHHRSELLGMFQLKDPSIIVSHELLETETKSCHTIKSTASSRTLTLIVKQDPLYLVEVADYVVKDELAQIHKLQKQLPESPAPPRRNSVKIAERLSSFRVNVAMFLDEYRISVPLLQSMTYDISGVVARAAVAANFGKELIFDFDVKENSHEIRMDVRNQPRSISLLRIPPTNGRIVSHMGPGEHSVSVFGSVELMQLDASAVYSLLTALNRPQISSAISELQEGTKAIQGHISDIFDETPAPKEALPPAQASNLVYTVHLTLAGIEVFGKTPLVSEKDPTACLSFKLDRVHLEVGNRRDGQGPILAQPQLHINLRQILIDVQKGRDNAMRSCGSLALGALMSANTRYTEDGKEERSFNFRSDGLEINLSPETVSTVVAALGYMGDKIKDLDTSRELEYLRKIRQTRPRIAINDQEEAEEPDIIDSFLSSIVYRFEVRDTQVAWLVGDPSNDLLPLASSKEDLILSVQLVSFGTRQTKSARLTIENFQLQMVPPGQDKSLRSLHSALLPEVIFNIAYVSNPNTRSLAFQAVGKSLDLRLTSGFIIPAAILKDSISLSIQNVQRASQNWSTGIAPTKTEKIDRIEEPTAPQRSIFGTKRLESLLIDADFSGAVVYVSGKKPTDGLRGNSRTARPSLAGKYGQFSTDDTGSSTVLRSPGLAWKLEYRDNGRDDPSLYGEIKIDASSNILYPSVVPLIMDMTVSVKEVVGKDKDTPAATQTPAAAKTKPGNEDNILTADPNAVIGRLKLNLGLRICRQEFSLSCQPIARVAATTCFEDIYFTVNTVRSQEQGNFFSISGAFSKLQASVQHVYSRESTGSFDVDSIVLSLMNSKHVSGTSGVSAILKVSPMTVSINAKQLQDFLLFREIWYPTELRNTSTAPVAKMNAETSQGHLVQRYQQVAATAAFPWTATISITSLDVSVDMGQAIGKSVFAIKEFWVSSKKTSDWEQNLCLGFEKIGIDCTGRLSGFIALQKFQLRTSIQWPEREAALNETPLIQASIGFSQFRVKAAFDYQAFLVADITSLELLMYNVRRSLEGTGDRLVAIFDGDAVQVFGTTTSAAQGVALYQAFQKLIQERRANFEMSLQEIEKFMRRRSYQNTATSPHLSTAPKFREEDTLSKAPISLDTDVVVTLKALNLGVFPSTFSDHQVFKMEALGAEARFAASIEQRRVHSILALTLGQLRIGLAGVRNIEAPKTLSEISVEDVVERATGSRGGTILKVPKVGAVMQTWQTPDRNRIEYIFKSAFEGKVEVGWNYSRISYIRGMWANHSKSLEQTWGKELPLTAIKVTGVPDTEEQQTGGSSQQKITAEVTVPQSKYDYVALEPPIIETPQLRDMGEATPPLEWIGLHRDRLPNLTHQIVIVALLELAGEVEDAYSKILGS
ncbi:fermentation associated protein [Colletotrichum sublineola]|uniref:Putative fermentation associated protein n=1 Tax=Colletotrichum sublineola TaxID=1173701 RepID=A0A066XX94_COLSU|nr:fermentation associated protein [Colletotrichum sublineola]KDN70575.1 putative fermentation associated protein [Colletotrichum sublineola]